MEESVVAGAQSEIEVGLEWKKKGKKKADS